MSELIDALVQIVITQGIIGPEKWTGLCEQRGPAPEDAWDRIPKPEESALHLNWYLTVDNVEGDL